jgi:two-component system sensor histidine kinase PhoQ
MLNTLFGRLFLASIIILSLCFGFIGYIINQLIVDNVYASKQEQLRIQNFVLLSSAQILDNKIDLPEELREPLFDDFESGLYGYVSDIEGNTLWSSYSAHSLKLAPSFFKTPIIEPGQFEYRIMPRYFIYHYVVSWELVEDQPQLLVFSVIEDSKPTVAAIKTFQWRLQKWLLVIAIGLIVTLMLILRWGTKPLRQLANNLKLIETGQAEYLQGKYPVELRSVASNMNQLIDSERAQRERYYTTMADLAHSLKTPLAVIQAELSHQPPSDQNSLITDQSQRMDEIITHQLQRAVVARSHQLTESIDIAHCVQRIITALEKVYASKQINFEKDIANNSLFKGDQRDLMEIIGNVMDNACKACKQQIKITVVQPGSQLQIAIHDDGDGIAAEIRTRLIDRGQRADTRHHGQGIGLDVVRDIIDSYQGELIIDQSPLGGAVFQFNFNQQA